MTNKTKIGILMLDTKFPRILGDIGNPATWNFPVIYKVVKNASPDAVVLKDERQLLQAFVEAGHELVAQGATGITTTCGFLSIYQSHLSNALRVPVLTSSLMQVQLVNALLPKGRYAGILTISFDSLKSDHLKAAGVPKNTPIGSTEGFSHFTRTFLNNEPELNSDLARQENVQAAKDLQRNHPNLGAFVLECTNMAPYARDISDATNLPVYSIFSLVTWFQSGLIPNPF